MSNDIYSAIGNEVRVKILLCLSEKPKTVSELITTCQLAQSAVSQHLAKLKQAGLVAADKKGLQVTYSLKYPQAAAISQLIQNLSRDIEL